MSVVIARASPVFTKSVLLILTMPPPAVGAIIVASILIAAGLAAYESDNIRAWVEKTKQNIVEQFDTLNNDIRPKRPIAMRAVSKDVSMTEEKGDAAEAKRQKLRAQIAERARVLEERAKKQRRTGTKSPSFDSLVDGDGKLWSDDDTPPATPTAETTAVETKEWAGELRSRRLVNIDEPEQQAPEASSSIRQLPVTQQNVADLEREMRSTFNIPLPERGPIMSSSHASESLLDLTPTTEDFPDPDYSIPSGTPEDRRSRDYFSAAASGTSQTASDSAQQFYYAHPSRPLEPLDGRSRTLSPAAFDYPPSSAPSVAGSTSIVHPHEAEMSEDDLISEPDGIRTPGSAWTEVGSTFSGDDRLAQ